MSKGAEHSSRYNILTCKQACNGNILYLESTFGAFDFPILENKKESIYIHHRYSRYIIKLYFIFLWYMPSHLQNCFDLYRKALGGPVPAYNLFEVFQLTCLVVCTVLSSLFFLKYYTNVSGGLYHPFPYILKASIVIPRYCLGLLPGFEFEIYLFNGLIPFLYISFLSCNL